MALMIKIRMEESKKELNIVIWNEEDADEVTPVENPIVNLKISLDTPNKEIAIDKDLYEGFTLKKTLSKDNKELVNEISDVGDEKNRISEETENKSESKNANIFTVNSEVIHSKDCQTKSYSKKKRNRRIISENGEMVSNQSLTNSVPDKEDEDKDLLFTSRSKCMEKKSEEFEGKKHKSYHSQNTIIISDTDCNDRLSECDQSFAVNEFDESTTLSTTSKEAIDTMSIASDDYSLMIEDDSTERNDVPQYVETKSVVNVSPRKEFSRMSRFQSCNKVLSKRTSRRQRMTAVQEMKFTCPICGFMSSLRKQLLLHLRIHGIESSIRKPPSITHSCSHCNRKYKSLNALKEHSKLHVPIPSRFFCKVSKMNLNFSDCS